MKLPSPGFLLSAFYQAFRRFPGTMICAILGTTLILILIENHVVGEQEKDYIRLILTCLLGVPLMTSLVAIGEARSMSERQVLLLQLGGIGLLMLCWWWLDMHQKDFDYLKLPGYCALLLFMHLAVSSGPFLNERRIRDFWDYNRQLFANLVTGVAFTLIIFVGLSLALLAIDQLFGISIRDNWYGRLFAILAGVFNTAYFLFQFPTVHSDQDEVAYTWVFRNLCKFILIPIVLFYFMILYAFGAKIGLEWELPNGWIASLVLGFSVAGIFTYLLNFYLPEEDKSILVSGFKRWFWWVVLPLTGLLFLAIGRRISDYGVTEERFIVASLGVWLLLNCLYFLISKNDNIKFIPVSLGIFALLGSFGPLSSVAVSVRSQSGILTEILEKNERFANGSMKPGTKMLTDQEYEKVYSATLYLSQRNGLATLLPFTVDSLADDPHRLLEWLNIEQSVKEGAIRTLNISADDYAEPMSVQGFDLAYKIDLATSQLEQRQVEKIFECSPDGTALEWWDISKETPVLIESYSLKPALVRWAAKMDPKQQYHYVNLNMEERSVLLTGKKGNLKLIIENGQIDMENGQSRLEGANCWILLKKK